MWWWWSGGFGVEVSLWGKKVGSGGYSGWGSGLLWCRGVSVSGMQAGGLGGIKQVDFFSFVLGGVKYQCSPNKVLFWDKPVWGKAMSELSCFHVEHGSPDVNDMGNLPRGYKLSFYKELRMMKAGIETATAQGVAYVINSKSFLFDPVSHLYYSPESWAARMSAWISDECWMGHPSNLSKGSKACMHGADDLRQLPDEFAMAFFVMKELVMSG